MASKAKKIQEHRVASHDNNRKKQLSEEKDGQAWERGESVKLAKDESKKAISDK